MGSKRRLMIICVVFLLAVASCVVFLAVKEPDYSEKILKSFDKAQEIKASEVFDFNFARAYVFDDCYISGAGFTLAHGLDLSIDEVKSGTTESIHRIVFVDENGVLVYEFQYHTNQIIFDNEGVVIYPDTYLTRVPSLLPGTITLHWESVEYYSDDLTAQ